MCHRSQQRHSVLNEFGVGVAFDDAAAAPQPQVDRLAITTSSGENSFIILMRADPKPVEDVTFAVAEGAVSLVYPCTPHLAEGL